MRRQARRESARAWIASGAAVTIKAYARRDGASRYTAYEDLTAMITPGRPGPLSDLDLSGP
jgi:hypothetical protein